MLWIGFISLFYHIDGRENLQYYPGPSDKSPEAFQNWFNEFSSLRDEISESLDLSIYSDVSEVQWARQSFIQPQVMIHERYLYDRESGQWTVGKYLDDVRSRYGGIDSILLWASYPNIGTDVRNQFDMLEDVPGGLEALRNVVEEFHTEGVKVLLPYNPWDQGTRNVGVPDYDILVDQIIQTNADGFNGDTLDGVNQTFWEAGVNQGHPIVIEPEVLFSNFSYLSYNTMSWGYWTPGARSQERNNIPPLVSMYKAVTKGKHMTHLTERWAQHHEDGIQQSFFNGAGFESWENVWGIWNGITERDGEAIRRTSNILRHFGNLVQGGEWIPHVVVTAEDNLVFASQFIDRDQGTSLWLLVNRDEENGIENLEVNLECFGPLSPQYFDVYHGIHFETLEECSGQRSLNISIEANGYGAMLMSQSADDEIMSFLKEMSEMTSQPLSSFNDEWTPLPQVMENPVSQVDKIPIPHKGDIRKSDLEIINVDGGLYNFFTIGNFIEGDRLPNSAGAQFPWETHAQRTHQHIMDIKPFLATKYPITNEDYKQFLDASGWRPFDEHNFLRHWNGSSSYPDGHGRKPVTWVSVKDAATFCHFYNMTLPTPWEWQYLAQGQTDFSYPWGNEPNPENVPEFSSGREMPDPDDVDAHPNGVSWCGAEDLVGNVYQWTRVFTDEHTSRAVIRGGSKWRPEGSHWYQPRPDLLGPVWEHNTYLIMDDSLDRSGGIGFRCVKYQ